MTDLDLDAIRAMADEYETFGRGMLDLVQEVPSLLAEVERLRPVVEAAEAWAEGWHAEELLSYEEPLFRAVAAYQEAKNDA